MKHMDQMIYDSCERLFASYSPTLVRALHEGGHDKAWEDVELSGFLDLLSPEFDLEDGAGLANLFPVLFAAGRHGVPSPVGETIFVRALLGKNAATGPVTIAQRVKVDAGKISVQCMPGKYMSQWVAASIEMDNWLLPVQDAVIDGGTLCWVGMPDNAVSLPADFNLFAAGALSTIVTISGAMSIIAENTVKYAKEREQFGRPLAAFQAVQQMISQLVEQSAMSRAAAEFSCRAGGSSIDLSVNRIGMGKIVVSRAATKVASIAHAVHGAIGLAEEHDLHLFTRLINQRRTSFGSDIFWARRVGEASLSSEHSMLDFIRHAGGEVK